MTWVTFDVNPENLPDNLRVQEWQGKPMFWQDPDGTIRLSPNGPVAQTTYTDRDTGMERSYFADPERPAWDTSAPATSPIVTGQAYGGYLGGLDLANIEDWTPYRAMMGQASNSVMADRGDNSMLGFLKDKGLMAFLGPLVAGGISSALAPGAATGATGGATGATGGLGSVADVIGSDWAAGLAGTANGGLLPTTAGGLTAGNLAAGSGVAGAVNSGLQALPSLSNIPGLPPGAEQLPAPVQNGPTVPSTGPGGSLPPLSSTLPAASTATKWLADKLGVSEGAIQALGAGASTLLGMYQESQKAGSLNDLAQQYANYGAPSRARYEASFGPGFDIGTADPAFAALKDQTSDSLLRKLSATGGNPYGNPGGMIEANKQIGASLDAPWLQNYRNQNASTGGYGAFNTAAPGAAMTAAGNDNNWMSVLGGGLSNILNPPQQTNSNTLADLLKKYALA